MATVIAEGECCVSCLIFMANGELPEDPAQAKAVEQGAANLGGYAVPNCGEDCEGHFSWSPCDCCGSRLGGERHPFVVLSR